MDVQQRLRLQASSVGEARELVRRALDHAGRGDLVETAVLLVSELVTNALLHAGTQAELSVSASGAGALVLVGDGSQQQPRIAKSQSQMVDDTGHGLVLVEQLSTAWGVMANPHGKVVWFQLDTPPTTRVSRPSQTSAAATVRVELDDLPVGLYQAWQQHAAERLREQLLVWLEAADEDAEVLRSHAHASNALTILTQHLRRSDGTTIDSNVHRDARGNALVQVPRGCVRDFTVLADTLADGAPDDAATTRRYGYHSHDLAALTQWLCGQVERQARGESPVPWQAPQT